MEGEINELDMRVTEIVPIVVAHHRKQTTAATLTNSCQQLAIVAGAGAKLVENYTRYPLQSPYSLCSALTVLLSSPSLSLGNSLLSHFALTLISHPKDVLLFAQEAAQQQLESESESAP